MPNMLGRTTRRGACLPPVPHLSESVGTHQRSKNAKLGGLLRRLCMSLKFEKKGCYFSLQFAKFRKRDVFLNRRYSNFAYKRIQMYVIESKRLYVIICTYILCI